ncbi:hypothetical protein HNP84_001880 [Thermocatellispora tengchongensis]|uniref:Uncharacterized protein n=1 Tax=Thermocatellispora tengchongensis TaxID=1073253 RepID=A0A840P4L2_9ACTN|nr:hypothetical protein [Thermocatellispora tengchongensis]MBB5132167.1 hypothetical protein [Thermocatellispora tengchongensis]
MRHADNWLLLRLRRYRPDGNELRRRSDRIEAAAVAFAILIVLLCVWPAVLTARAVYADGLAAERVGPGGRVQVTATLAEEGPVQAVTTADGRVTAVTAPASWRAPDGRTLSGTVVVPTGAKAGAPVRIWVDDEGRRVPPPQTRLETVARSGIGAGLVITAGVTVSVAGFACFRAVLDRHRYREWETAWSEADARWHGTTPS